MHPVMNLNSLSGTGLCARLAHHQGLNPHRHSAYRRAMHTLEDDPDIYADSIMICSSYTTNHPNELIRHLKL
jgi:hypothetical protein